MSPFARHVLELNITLTDRFPQVSPSIGISPNAVYHPNIDFHSGSVCVDRLNDGFWKQSNTLSDIADYILPNLLAEPNPDDPLNADAA